MRCVIFIMVYLEKLEIKRKWWIFFLVEFLNLEVILYCFVFDVELLVYFVY